MATVARLSLSDVDRALAVAREAAAADGDQPFELPLIDRLRALVPADWAGYYEFQVGNRSGENLFEVDTRLGPDVCDLDWGAADLQAAFQSWPLLDERRGCPPTALKLSDFLTGRELRRTPWYLEVMRADDSAHELKLWLPAPSGTVRGFFFNRLRGRPDFDERDRTVLTLLRPHLDVVRRRWEERRRPAGLSAREAEVLALVRHGLSNRAIAERLFISPSTVRTHLENIFAKLDVHNRTAAIARVSAGAVVTE